MHFAHHAKSKGQKYTAIRRLFKKLRKGVKVERLSLLRGVCARGQSNGERMSARKEEELL
jgi:hypothetical protein